MNEGTENGFAQITPELLAGFSLFDSAPGHHLSSRGNRNNRDNAARRPFDDDELVCDEEILIAAVGRQFVGKRRRDVVQRDLLWNRGADRNSEVGSVH